MECMILEIATTLKRLMARNCPGFVRTYKNPTTKNGRIFSRSFLCARLTLSTSSTLNTGFSFPKQSSGFANAWKLIFIFQFICPELSIRYLVESKQNLASHYKKLSPRCSWNLTPFWCLLEAV
jgi:hypothetical protein